jgi:hypothetical protein
MILTRRVKDRRRLRFENFEDVLRDAESLASAECARTLRASGNWKLGQVLGHLAFWADAAFDGYPDLPRPSWLMRKLMPLFRKYVSFKRMPAGFRFRGVEGGTFGITEMSTEGGLDRLRRAYNRLASQTPPPHDQGFGEMSRDELLGFHLRHAELHLSFFHPQ